MFKSFGLIFIGFKGQFLANYGVIRTLTTLDGAFHGPGNPRSEPHTLPVLTEAPDGP
jgi:hypothetical protein